MRLPSGLVAVLLLAASATAVFYFFQRRLTNASMAVGVPVEVTQRLEESLDDLKRLAELDPGREQEIRRRFDRSEATLRHLRILEHSRRDLEGRYQLILLVLFAASVVIAGIVWALRLSRQENRLTRIRDALESLGRGQTDLDVGVQGRDTVGRIAGMIEVTSRAIARDRQRLAALRNLSAWQEAARRHAHEMRTPLTAARLEMNRVVDLLSPAPQPPGAEIRQAATSAVQELDRLGEFTHRFTSFARLPHPERRRLDLGELVEEFAQVFAGAWANLLLEVAETAGALAVAVDRDMLRQVLVNLCDNASQALGEEGGTVSFSLGRGPEGPYLDVADDGPGISEEVRSRLFEPYATTRTVGEGMGLGLAICKKILLDHAGDLELRSSGPEGTTFRLSFPPPESGDGGP